MKYILYIHMFYAQWSQVNIQKPMDTLQSVQHRKKVEHLFLVRQVLAEKNCSHISPSRPYVLSRATDGSCRRSSSLLVSRCCWWYPLFKWLAIDEKTWQATLFLQRQPRTFLQHIGAILKTNHIGWFNDSTTKTLEHQEYDIALTIYLSYSIMLPW